MIRVLVFSCVALAFSIVLAPAARTAERKPVPLLAYYYIWYQQSSWNRAKADLPLLGPYSSDEQLVLRRHVAWAKHAGLDGFIVSWKSTPVLDRRLAKLRAIAARQGFKLAIMYQGLDFERRPLPPAQVARDLSAFVARYGADPVFHVIGAKPLVVWSGTWKFSPADVREVRGRLRGRALLLASERTAAGYERVARFVDGDAYYYASARPTDPGYRGRLDALSKSVRADRGVWVAPAAPGFDATLIGGSIVVGRHGGETLRTELSTALASTPDLVGIISWNEFSEGTHLEPSVRYGERYLDVLSDILGAPAPAIENFDSDSPPPIDYGNGVPLVATLLLVFGAGSFALIVRGRRRPPPS
jgi:hypothetical protein